MVSVEMLVALTALAEHKPAKKMVGVALERTMRLTPIAVRSFDRPPFGDLTSQQWKHFDGEVESAWTRVLAAH